MTTQLEFRVQELARERAVLLLSKASGVSLEGLQRIETPVTSEECTPEFLSNLSKLSEALNVFVLDLLASDESRTILIDRIIELMDQTGVSLPPEPGSNSPVERPEGPDGEAPAIGSEEQIDEFQLRERLTNRSFSPILCVICRIENPPGGCSNVCS